VEYKSSPEMGNLTDHPNSAQPFKQLYFQEQNQSQCYCLVANEALEIQSAKPRKLFSYLPAKAISSSHDILSQMPIASVTNSTLDIYTTSVG